MAMSDSRLRKDATPDPASPDAGATEKVPWHPPTLEEVDYSATEISGVGGVYDFTVYSGSQ
jgi:hypothetical protein